MIELLLAFLFGYMVLGPIFVKLLEEDDQDGT